MLALPWHEALQNHAHNAEEPESRSHSLAAENIYSSDDEHVTPSNWTILMREAWMATYNLEDSPLRDLLASYGGAKDDLFSSERLNSSERIVLLEHLRSQTLTDMRIISNDKINIFAHKVILSIHSEYFRTLFLDTWWASREDHSIELDCSSSSLNAILEYFYSGNLDSIMQSGDIVIGCLKLGHLLLAGALVDELTPVVMELVDDENAVSLLSVAEALDIKPLRDRCISVMIQKLTSVEQSQYFEELGPRVRSALSTLRANYLRCVTIHGGVFDNIRELLAMIKDALMEEEEAYELGRRRNEEELTRWREAGGEDATAADSDTISASNEPVCIDSPPAPSPTNSIFEARNARWRIGMTEWRERLQRVEDSLVLRHNHITKLRERYQEQRGALDVLLQHCGQSVAAEENESV